MDDKQPVNENSDEMEVSSNCSDDALQVKFEESGEDSPAVDSPLSPDEPENQHLPSGMLAETSPPPALPAASSPPALMGSVDALLSPGHDSIESPRPVLDHPGVMEATDTPSLPQHSPVRLTKSPHGSEAVSRPVAPISTSEEQIADDGSKPASVKRRRSETPESDDDESGTKDELLASALPPSAAEESLDQSPIVGKTLTSRNASPNSEALESSANLRVTCHKKRKIMESGYDDALKPDVTLPASDDDTEQRSQLNLQTEDDGPIVEESKLANEGEASTSSRGGCDDPDSVAKHPNPEDVNQIANFSNLPTDERETNVHSNASPNPSLPCLNEVTIKQEIRSPDAGSSSVQPSSSDKVPISELLVQSSVDSESVAEHSNPDDLHLTRSCINPLPEDAGDKDGTLTSKPKVKSRKKLKEPFKSLKSNLASLKDGTAAPEISTPEIPSQENEMDNSPAGLSRNVLNAGTLLLEIVRKLMTSRNEKAHFKVVKELVDLLHKKPFPEGDIWLQETVFRYEAGLNIEENSNSYENIECVLLRIALESLVFTTLQSSMNFEAIMANYRSFKYIYENCREVLNDANVDNAQDEGSSKRKKSINTHLSRMKIAFHFLLIHVGKYVDLKSKDKYVEQLFEDDVKYLIIRI